MFKTNRMFLMIAVFAFSMLISVLCFLSSTHAQIGIDSYAKLMLRAEGSGQGTSFTDSATTPKTVTNAQGYDSATKLMLHTEGSGNSFTDSTASKAVTANADVTQTTAQLDCHQEVTPDGTAMIFRMETKLSIV